MKKNLEDGWMSESSEIAKEQRVAFLKEVQNIFGTGLDSEHFRTSIRFMPLIIEHPTKAQKLYIVSNEENNGFSLTNYSEHFNLGNTRFAGIYTGESLSIVSVSHSGIPAGDAVTDTKLTIDKNDKLFPLIMTLLDSNMERFLDKTNKPKTDSTNEYKALTATINKDLKKYDLSFKIFDKLFSKLDPKTPNLSK